jgi:hypothetical protein
MAAVATREERERERERERKNRKNEPPGIGMVEAGGSVGSWKEVVVEVHRIPMR